MAAERRSGPAQEPEDERPPNHEMQRQELVNLEKENARAIKLHNPTFFKSAYSEDFHRVSRYGEVAKKSQWFAKSNRFRSNSIPWLVPTIKQKCFATPHMY
jgi:hypothetical protein